MTNFFEVLAAVRRTLEAHGRVSLRALQREFDLDEAGLEELIDELVDIQQVARRNGKALEWAGPAESASVPQPATPNTLTPNTLSSAEAERRQLTVLFCDLVDSTRLAAGLDPEDWREVIRAWQDSCRAVVERFAGHVARYLGDGLLVYFGWPRAHEDDVERAVRAGLGILEAMTDLNVRLQGEARPALAVRIGVHTGPVVAGELGAETQVLGHTMNLAARLEGEAAPDTLVISATTLRLVQGLFVVEALGPRGLKGLEESVVVYRVVRPSGVRSRLDVAAATGLTPLVGREQELGLLEDRWAQVRESWGQAVLISGEAGIGKSRLVHAFRERLAESPHTWLECRCSPYTQDSAFYPVLELHRQALGFGPEDSERTKRERIAAGLAAAGFALPETMPLLGALHALPPSEHYPELPLSPEGKRKKTLELMSEWLLRLGREQPVILLMEDLHWVDPSSAELLGRVLDQAARAPVLLLLTYRPDFTPPWGPKSHVTPMLLSRLTRGQLGELVQEVARGRVLPEEWVEEIVRRSDGVPLFAEELTRTVLESHPVVPGDGALPALVIPDTLKDSLTARLDQLGPVKEVAQLAAVLGREFSYDLLLQVSPLSEERLKGVLGEAIEEELFYQRGEPPEATYLFKHALIRDAAYESMLRATRQRHHRRVAQTLIERLPHIAAEQPELVAHHWTQAGETEAAVTWWERAGTAAKARVAHEEAIRHLRSGLREVGRLLEGPARNAQELSLLLPLGTSLVSVRGYAHEETEKTFERARQLCDERVEGRRAGIICYYLASLHSNAGHFERGLEFFRECERIGREHGDELLVVAGLADPGQVYSFLPHLGAGLRSVEAACELYAPERHQFVEAGFGEDVGISGWGWLAWLRWYAGYPEGSRSAAERGQTLAECVGDPYTHAIADCNAAFMALLRRDWTEARRLADEALRQTSEQGFALYESLAALAEAWAAGVGAMETEALDRYTGALARAASTGTQLGAPIMFGGLAQLQFVAGRPAEAAQTAEGALGIAEATGQHVHDAELHRLRAECFLLLPDHTTPDAEVELGRALDIARSQEAKSLELRAATSLARLWRDQGKREEVRTLLQPLYDWFTEGFDTPDLKDAKALLEELG